MDCAYKPIIVALDFPTETEAWQMVELLDPARCRLKIGKELFTRAGPGLVRRVIDGGFDVFLDLKYHDIPNTVAAACSAAADLGCWMINVHASGGRAMMDAACERLAHRHARPLLVAVTVLTSMDEAAVGEVGFGAVGGLESGMRHGWGRVLGARDSIHKAALR